MAKLSDVIRSGIRIEDLNLPQDIRTGLEPLVRYLNTAMQSVSQVLSNGVGISDNLNTETQTVPLTHGVAQLISLKKLSQAKGVRALSVGSPDGKTQNMLAQPLHLIGTTVPNQVKVIANFADTTATRVPVTMELTPEGSYTSLTPSTGTWTAPTLTNAWANLGGGSLAAGYLKDSGGFMHLRGTIQSGTIGLAAFTLPSGFRPTGTARYAVPSNGAFGEVDITSAGLVTPSVGSNVAMALDGISFDTRT